MNYMARLPSGMWCGWGVARMAVSFSVSAKWLRLLTGFKQREKISMDYFGAETLAVRNAEMFIDGYKAGLVKDTSYKGLWKVSFTPKEL